MKQPLKQQFLGFDTNYFFGKVVNRFDDNERGRVRVRIFGIHPDDKTLVPDEDLPWAWPIQSLMSAAVGEVGMTPHALMEDSIVFGIFSDGTDAQMPVILGTLQSGALPPLAIGTQSLDKQGKGIEPGTPYAAEYPFNRVYQSESGHVVEVDDTPGAERIHVWHRKGSYSEWGPDGSVVHKVIGDGYSVFAKDNNVFTEGQTNIYAKGNVSVQAYNDANMNVSGDANISVKGDFRVKAASAFIEAETIHLDGAVRATTLDTPTLVADGASFGDVEASSIQAGSVQSSFSPGGGSGGGAETPEATGLNTPQERDDSVYVPDVDDYHAFVNDDLDNGDTTSTGETVVAEEGQEVGEQPTTTTPPITTECGISISEGQEIEPIQLTSHFTVGKLSAYTPVSPTRIIAQGGLTVGQIVCNLKLLAQNCLEPMLAQYSDMIVTHAFRTPAARSQHTKGMAADIQFTSLNAMTDATARKRAYFERAQWVANNISFDDFILEYKTYGSGLPWLHVSFNKENLRGQVRSAMSRSRTDVTYHQGLLIL